VHSLRADQYKIILGSFKLWPKLLYVSKKPTLLFKVDITKAF
jgi:hypothetical protein